MVAASSEDTRSGWHTLAVTALSGLLTLSAVAWALGLSPYLGFEIYPQQYFAFVLSIALALVFLDRPNAHLPLARWLNPLLAATALATGGFIALRYPELVNQVFTRPVETYLPGSILIVLMLIALMKTAGKSLAVIVVGFLIYAVFGDALPGRLAANAQDWPRLAGYLGYDSNGILGLALSVAASIVVCFILFGTLLVATGGTRFFTDAAQAAMGDTRGGPMKVAIAASALFGSTSGSAVANVAATGAVTIPMIKRAGFPSHKAAAIEAAASTGSQLMPPVMGAAAFLMAEFLQVSYREVVLAALIPALLYYAALFIQADLDPATHHPTKAQTWPVGRAVLGGMHFLGAFAALLAVLFVWNWQPGRAALLAGAVIICTALVFGYRKQRPTIATILRAIPDAGRAAVDVIIISAAAGIVIGVLNLTGLGFSLTYVLVQIAGSIQLLLLALSALVCILLGMGLPTLGVYVLLAALVVPALIQTGVDPMAAHLFVLYFGMMSMITPPVAIAAFAAAAIAGARPMQTGIAAVRFGWTAYVIPFLFALSPTFIGRGPVHLVIFDVATALLGILACSAAIAGRLLGPLGWDRSGFAICGLLCMLPASTFQQASDLTLVGCAGVVLLIAKNWLRRRNDRSGTI